MTSQRILLIRLSALGDVVLATPALRALKQAFPAAAIDWVTEAPYAPILRGSPHLRDVIAYDKRGAHRGVPGLLRLQKELRARDYDLVVDLQAKPKTRALSMMLGAAVVASLQKRTRTQALQSAVGLERPLVRAHAVDLYLEALAPLGVKPAGRELELFPSAHALEAGAALGPGGWVGLAPGARWATKRWSPASFAQVGRALEAQGHRVLLVGGPGDQAELAAVRAAWGPGGEALRDTLALDVDGLIGAVGRCAALVAGDSGPVHLASALRVPVVALFGPTAPERWAPRTGAFRVVTEQLICSPCSNHGTAVCPIRTHACMRAITPTTVLEAVGAVLASPPLALGPAPRLLGDGARG